MLVTTHYLDEAEHCHRIAIINAGKLAAIGTSRELKQVFADRPIVEIQSAQPVEVDARARRDGRKSRRRRVRHRRSRRAEASAGDDRDGAEPTPASAGLSIDADRAA